MGTQKNRLNETFFSHTQQLLKPMDKKIFTILREKKSRPMGLNVEHKMGLVRKTDFIACKEQRHRPACAVRSLVCAFVIRIMESQNKKKMESIIAALGAYKISRY